MGSGEQATARAGRVRVYIPPFAKNAKDGAPGTRRLGQEGVPQGLKPLAFGEGCGTAEAVPLSRTKAMFDSGEASGRAEAVPLGSAKAKFDSERLVAGLKLCH